MKGCSDEIEVELIKFCKYEEQVDLVVQERQTVIFLNLGDV